MTHWNPESIAKYLHKYIGSLSDCLYESTDRGCGMYLLPSGADIRAYIPAAKRVVITLEREV